MIKKMIYEYDAEKIFLKETTEKYNQWVSTDTNSVSNEPKKELLND